jgi:Na+/H+ antiporter NhaD/arsenite permease-like protein
MTAIAVILLILIVIVFIAMARQKFGPELGMPMLALAGLAIIGIESAGAALGHGFDEFGRVAVTFTAVAVAAHQLRDSNLLHCAGLLMGNAIGRSAQKLHVPVAWAAAFFCLFTTWALAAALHNTTSILVMAPLIITVCSQFEIAPLPVLYASLIASNLGGFSTRWGDTPNIVEASVWGLMHKDFCEIMIVNLGMLVILVAIVGARLPKVSLTTVELESFLYRFDAARRSLSINWNLSLSAFVGLLVIIVLPIIMPHTDLRFAAIGVLWLCLGQRLFGSKAQRGHNPFDALGFETLSTLAAVFVLAAVLSRPEVGIIAALQQWLANSQAPVWAIALLSYVGTLLTEAASWASAAAPSVYALDPTNRAAWALGAGICAGSSSLVTAASAGILLMKQTRQTPEHAVTFGGYLKFGLPVSAAMLVYYYVALSLLYRP